MARPLTDRKQVENQIKAKIKEQMVRAVTKYAPSSRIAKSVSVYFRGNLDSRLQVSFRIMHGEYSNTPDALAWEFGSGEHSQNGPQVRYIIKPRLARRLAFHWEIANKNPQRFKFAPDGRVLLPMVRHPGIKAANNGRGFVRLAFENERQNFQPYITNSIRGMLVLSKEKFQGKSSVVSHILDVNR